MVMVKVMVMVMVMVMVLPIFTNDANFAKIGTIGKAIYPWIYQKSEESKELICCQIVPDPVTNKMKSFHPLPVKYGTNFDIGQGEVCLVGPIQNDIFNFFFIIWYQF